MYCWAGHLFLPGEAHRLAADRVVLAEWVALPVVLHEDPAKVGMPLEAEAHHVPGLSLVPVRGRPDRDDALERLAGVDPDLDAHPRRAVAEREQVVVDREPLRLRLGDPPVALRCDRDPEVRRRVQVAPGPGPVVAGDTPLAPAEVVRRCDVGEEVEPFDVAEVEACLPDPGGVDDERRLAVFVLRLDEPGDAFKRAQEATPRISYAGGTPALIFSCNRMMPSTSASGRGGQPGTWMSTATILSTPWRTV